MLARILLTVLLLLVGTGLTLSTPGDRRGVLNTTITLVNDSTSPQAAGQPTQTFGMAFPDGQLCSGAAPVFKDPSSNVLPFSYGLLAYWPSGCLRFGSFMLLPQIKTAGSGTSPGQTITVTGGGSWPTQGSGTAGEFRSLTDLYNQSLVVSLPANPALTDAVSGANLTGTWKSWLDSAATTVTATFNGQISGSVLTVNSISAGSIAPGSGLDGAGITANSMIGLQLTGTPGSTGTYRLNQTYGSPVSAEAMTQSNTYKIVKWLDGDAGTCWRISADMAQTKTGAAHGQLDLDHYICALNNNTSHGLGGFRWLGAARQPKYDYDTPAKNIRVFHRPCYASDSASDCSNNPANGPSWSVGSGAQCTGNGCPMTWLGGDGQPMTCRAFTVSGNSQPAITTTPHNYYLGADPGGNGQGLAVQFLGGSLPSSGSLNSLLTSAFWLVVNNGTNNTLTNQDVAFYAMPTGGASAPSNGAGQPVRFTSSGSGTVCPIPEIMPFTRLFFADSKGRYNFFQGTGSISAETTLRVAINQTYLKSTHMMLPADTSVSGVAKGGTVPLSPWTSMAEFTVPVWHPYSIGYTLQYEQQTGDHGDLGPWTNGAADAFYNDTAINDLEVRAEGLAGGLFPADFKDATTDTIINVQDTSTSTFTGLPNSVATTVGYQAGGTPYCAGYTCTPPGNASLVVTNNDTSHKPQFSAFPYLKTGELQFLDILIDSAQYGIISLNGQDITNRNPTTPDAFNGMITAFSTAEPRTRAWAHRDLQWAAAFVPCDLSQLPSSCGSAWGSWDGTETTRYIVQWAANNVKFETDWMNPANNVFDSATAYVAGCATAPTVYCPTSGRAIAVTSPNISTADPRVAVGDVNWYGGEESMYAFWAFAIAAMTRQDANAIQWLNYWVGGRYYELRHFTAYNIPQFISLVAIPTYNNFAGHPSITSDNQWLSKMEFQPWAGAFTWTNSHPTFSLTASGQTLTLHNGDPMMFCDDSNFQESNCPTMPPGGFSTYTTYYIKNLTLSGGNTFATFDLAPCTTRGTNNDCSVVGTAINAFNTGSTSGGPPGWWLWSTGNRPPTATVQGAFIGNGDGVPTPYYAGLETARFILGNSITELNAVLSEFDARYAKDGWNPATGSCCGAVGYVPRYYMHY